MFGTLWLVLWPVETCPGAMAPPRKSKLPKPLPDGFIVTDTEKKPWRLGRIIGQGGFGLIYLGTVMNTLCAMRHTQNIHTAAFCPTYPHCLLSSSSLPGCDQTCCRRHRFCHKNSEYICSSTCRIRFVDKFLTAKWRFLFSFVSLSQNITAYANNISRCSDN